jgi:hypothetical protein
LFAPVTSAIRSVLFISEYRSGKQKIRKQDRDCISAEDSPNALGAAAEILKMD